MSDPVDELPAEIRARVLRIHERQVSGSSAQCTSDGDRSGLGLFQPVTHGRQNTIAWMKTPAFRELVSRHEAALAGRATIYFRPTGAGLVRIALHPAAPGYIGFRRAHNDNGHIVRPGTSVPSIDEIRRDFSSFEPWMKECRRASNEERGVIAWLRSALTRHLWLPELGDGWAFLHQEWRFTNAAGRGSKADILAVHLPSGQLGIAELKAEARDLTAARTQVEEYGRLWKRDAAELAPLFTTLIQSLGDAYGNHAAASATVEQRTAALFVGVATVGRAVRIHAHAA